jgi:hypothetical protein
VTALPTLIERIRSEYLALPGLKLTVSQARRLWPASDAPFQEALDALVAEGFLCHLPSGAYIAMPRPHQSTIKSDLPPAATDRLLRCPHCRKLNAIHREQTLTRHSATTTLRCAGCGRIVSVSALSA